MTNSINWTEMFVVLLCVLVVMARTLWIRGRVKVPKVYSPSRPFRILGEIRGNLNDPQGREAVSRELFRRRDCPGEVHLAQIGKERVLLFDGGSELTNVARLIIALTFHRLKESTCKERAYNVLNVWAAFLPARISQEDLGDYLEDIDRRLQRNDSPCIIYIRVAAAVFWTGVNTVSYFLKAIRQKSST